jgi:hypothetical protein
MMKDVTRLGELTLMTRRREMREGEECGDEE